MRRRQLLVSAGTWAFACESTLASAAASFDPTASASAAEERTLQLRCSATFRNPNATAARAQNFWMYAPMDQAGRQTLLGATVSMPSELLGDEFGHRILQLKLTGVAPLATKVVSMSFEVKRLPQAKASAPAADAALWLSPQKYIESDAPEIRTLAGALRASTARQTAGAVYDWIRQHLRYAGYIADDLGALAAVRGLRGDCTEYAYLAVALARANDIPARMVGGHVAGQSTVLAPQDYHNWAEVLIDGAWCVLDAQRNVWNSEEERDYIAFRHYAPAMNNPVGPAHRYRLDGDLDVALV